MAVVLLVLLAFSFPSLVESQSRAVRILEAKAGSRSLVAGAPGVVPVDLVVKLGFKVAKRPVPKLQLNAVPSFEVGVGGFVESIPAKDPDYFGAFKPLELRIVPTRTTKPGKYSLEGKLTYFYCSEQDKYCSRSVEPVLIPVEVVASK